MNLEAQYQFLIESLRLVAASPEEQVNALPDFVCVADEIATTFGDAFLLVPQLEQADLVSKAAVEVLRRLDSLFESGEGVEELAEPEMLRTHESWAEARRLAGEALDALEEERRLPVLSHITWIQGRSQRA